MNWVALVGDDTGGTAILSYNLEMLVGDVEVELVGMTSYYKDTSYLKQTGIVSGQSYKFRVRARNKWGYGPYSNWVSIEASTNPDYQSSKPITQNSGNSVLISWPKP